MGSAKGSEGVQAAEEKAEEPLRPGGTLARTPCLISAHPPFLVRAIYFFIPQLRRPRPQQTTSLARSHH